MILSHCYCFGKEELPKIWVLENWYAGVFRNGTGALENGHRMSSESSSFRFHPAATVVGVVGVLAVVHYALHQLNGSRV